MKITDIGFVLAFGVTAGMIGLIIHAIVTPPKDRCPECRCKGEH